MTPDEQARLEAIKDDMAVAINNHSIKRSTLLVHLAFLLDLLARQDVPWLLDLLARQSAAQETLRQERDEAQAKRMALWENIVSLETRGNAVAADPLLPRYNCDCLNAGPDGRPIADHVNDEGVYVQRWIVLWEDAHAMKTRAESAERERDTLQAQLVTAQEALLKLERQLRADCERERHRWGDDPKAVYFSALHDQVADEVELVRTALRSASSAQEPSR